jgi:hypothetical protein
MPGERFGPEAALATRAEAHRQAIARQGQRHEHARIVQAGDAVAARADRLDHDLPLAAVLRSAGSAPSPPGHSSVFIRSRLRRAPV